MLLHVWLESFSVAFEEHLSHLSFYQVEASVSDCERATGTSHLRFLFFFYFDFHSLWYGRGATNCEREVEASVSDCERATGKEMER